MDIYSFVQMQTRCIGRLCKRTQRAKHRKKRRNCEEGNKKQPTGTPPLQNSRRTDTTRCLLLKKAKGATLVPQHMQ